MSALAAAAKQESMSLADVRTLQQLWQDAEGFSVSYRPSQLLLLAL